MADFLSATEFKDKLNTLGKDQTPCLFFSDFEGKKFFLTTNLNDPNILYKFDNISNYTSQNTKKVKLSKKQHIDFQTYQKMFQKVQNNIKEGNTYLLNLTAPTTVHTNATLKEIFYSNNAKFKLLFNDQFTYFSPERFIQIKENQVYTYPMKGTIDSDIPNAKEKIINDQKELAEHTMIVDLMRNDLSQIAHDVKVKKFRYIENIKTNHKNLLQVSSEIEAQLPQNWKENLGDIITTLLPAGSISGTPKKMTTDIIKNIENYERGFFTGICGLFDGHNLDSAVMIRFIDKTDESLTYKSGGGITIKSDVRSEYEEMCDKVYIPNVF